MTRKAILLVVAACVALVVRSTPASAVPAATLLAGTSVTTVFDCVHLHADGLDRHQPLSVDADLCAGSDLCVAGVPEFSFRQGAATVLDHHVVRTGCVVGQIFFHTLTFRYPVELTITVPHRTYLLTGTIDATATLATDGSGVFTGALQVTKGPKQ
jgi:hypothetical protein